MRRTRLAGLQAPTPVEIHGVLSSPATVTSPVTGRTGVAIQYYVLVPKHARPGAGFDHLVESGLWGESLLVDTTDGEMGVPLDGVTIYFQGANPEPRPLLEPLPDAFAHLRGPATYGLLAAGDLYLRELYLVPGQPVRVRGVAAPSPGRGAYRIAANVPFVLRGDLEPATLSVDVPEFA